MESERPRVTVLALLVSMHTGQAFSSPPVGGGNGGEVLLAAHRHGRTVPQGVQDWAAIFASVQFFASAAAAPVTSNALIRPTVTGRFMPVRIALPSLMVLVGGKHPISATQRFAVNEASWRSPILTWRS